MAKIEHEENNYVIGWDISANGLCNGRAVMDKDEKTRLGVDYTKPVTLERCKTIFAKACELSGRNLGAIELRHSIYSKTPGNEYGDFPEQCFHDKSYRYDPKANSLTIFDRGECVYINENGSVLRGDSAHVAYCDGLDV